MKLLHTADWHLGPFKGPADKDGMNLRYKTTVKCLEFMVETAKAQHPDIVCVSGDIFHQEQVGPVRYSDEMLTATRIITELAETAKLVIVMRGTPNHDGAGQFRVLEKMLEGNRRVIVVTEPRVIATRIADFAVVPGFDKQEFRAKFPGLSADEENQVWTEQIGQIVSGLRAQCTAEKTILMAHYTVPGCNIESGQTSCYANFEPVLPREVLNATAFDYALLGHIHRPQKVEGLDGVYYAGAINALNFNDEGQVRGFWIHDTEGESQFFITPHNQFQTLNWEPDDVASYLMDGQFMMVGMGYKELLGGKIVRLRYTCDDAQKRALNIPVLQADLMEMGAFYVANIESEQTVEVQNRGLMNEESDPYENLKKWLDEKCVKDAGAVADLAAPIIGEALKQIEANEYQGEFKPVKIAVKNYRAYKEAEFDYTDINFLSVNGVNGAGKSSLFFDAPMDCLFEKTREGDVKAWLRAAPDARSGFIEFTFAIGENTFRVTRTRQKSGKGTVNLSRLDAGGEWVNMSSEKGVDTQKEIEHVLGMDYMTFKTCALIMQDQYGLFLEARKDERIAILSNLLGLSIYGVMEKSARELLASAKRDYASGKTAVQVKEQQISAKGDPEAELKNLEEHLKDITESIEAREEGLKSLKAAIEETVSLTDKLNDIKSQTSAVQGEISAEKLEMSKLVSSIEDQEQILSTEAEINARVTEYEQAMQLVSDLAPDVAKYEAGVERLKALDAELGDMSDAISTLATNIEDGKLSISMMECEIEQAKDVPEKVAELETAKEELDAAKEKREQYNAALTERNTKKSEIQLESKSIAAEIGVLRQKLDSAERQKEFMANSGCIDAENATCRFLKQAKQEVATISELTDEIDKRSNNILRLNKAMQRAEEECTSKLAEIGYDPFSITKLNQRIRELTPYKAKLEQIASQKLRIASLRASIDEKVKTLEEKHKDREKRKLERSDVSETVNRLSESVEKYAGTQSVADSLRRYLDIAKELPAIKASYQANVDMVKKHTEVINQKKLVIDSLDADRAEILEKLDGRDLATDKALADEVEAEIKDLKSNGDVIRMQMGAAKQRIEDISSMRDEIKSLKSEIDAASDRAAKYEVLKVAFSQDGVPHQIIRNIIPYIRDKANGILGAMTGGTMGVDFVMEKTVKGRDGEKATLDILIEEYGKTTLPYTSKSGGEKVKASLAVNLSLAEVKMEASGVQIGFLGVDEPPFLDEDGTQAYVDSMEAIRKRNPRISIIAITHDPAMKARFSQSLTVVKTADEGSKIIYD